MISLFRSIFVTFRNCTKKCTREKAFKNVLLTKSESKLSFLKEQQKYFLDILPGKVKIQSANLRVFRQAIEVPLPLKQGEGQ